MAYDPITYQRNKVQKFYTWGNLKCLERSQDLHVYPRENGVQRREEEDRLKLVCGCGNQFDVWVPEFDPKIMDCGCGSWEKKQAEQIQVKKPRGRPATGKNRVVLSLSLDIEVIYEVTKYAESQGISTSEASNRLLQLGLGNAA